MVSIEIHLPISHVRLDVSERGGGHVCTIYYVSYSIHRPTQELENRKWDCVFQCSSSLLCKAYFDNYNVGDQWSGGEKSARRLSPWTTLN